MDKKNISCKVCQGSTSLFYENGRRFFRCAHCAFIFSPLKVSREEEEQHYKSQWGLADAETWRSKAEVLLNVILQYNTPKSILDFGSGCGSLTQAFRVLGYPTTPLEPMIHGFLKDQEFKHPFDAIVGIEVIEHLPDPVSELRELEKVLAPGGVMVFSTLMTNAFINHPLAQDHFSSWWYKDDPTHVSFFSNQTLDALARLRHYEIDVFADKLFAIRKS